MTRTVSAIGSVMALSLSVGCNEMTLEKGEWTEVHIDVDVDLCLLTDDLTDLQGKVRYSLGAQTVSPTTGVWNADEPSEEMMDAARTNLWSALSSLDGPNIEFAFPPVALHADRWGAGMFMHEDCDGQPTSINVGGSASGMIMSPTEILISTEILPECIRDGSRFRWCKLQYTSRLVPANGSGN